MHSNSHARRRRRAIVASLLCGSLLVAACGGDDGESTGSSAPESTPAPDGSSAPETTAAPAGTSLVIAIADEPSTLDPQATEDGNERAVTDNIYETLVRRNSETNELEPLLATELPTQVDGTTWEFKLREGVTFSNGDPFNAEAAAFSINRVMDPEYNSAQVDFYGAISEAVAVDEYTVQVKLSAPDPVFPARMYRLKMMSPTATDASITETAVGTGPYTLVSWERGQQVVLTANPTYWGTKPPVSDVVIKFIPEASTRVAGLQAGEIHLATLVPPELVKDAPQVLTRDGIEFPVFRLKNYDGVLSDPRVRQAMNYAIDNEAIAQDLFSGFASVAQCQPLTEAHFGYNPELSAYPYDPAKAEQLLAEAGYNGEEVTLLGPTGRWLKDQELGEVIVGFLTEVGLNVKTDIRPFSSYIDEFVQTVGEPQPDIGQVSASNELFDASKIESYYLSTGGLSSYVNEEVDAALEAARSEADPAKRAEYFATATKIGCEDDPVFIFTINLQDIYGAATNLTWTPRADGSLFVPEMVLG